MGKRLKMKETSPPIKNDLTVSEAKTDLRVIVDNWNEEIPLSLGSIEMPSLEK
jgi:hypothetical protein